jgi:hypothetical protein
LSVAAIAALALASSASAAITSSQITSPTGPAFGIYNEDAPNTIAVTGTTTGGTSGVDEVNIDCFTGSQDLHLALGFPIAPDGSFSVPAADLSNISFAVCRLRAVPTGPAPSDLAPFAGPLVAIGHKRTEVVESGPNLGKPYNYFLNAQQLTAADSYYSLSYCGLEAGFLFNANLERTTSTFGCNDWFWSYENYQEESASTRSQIQVDGANAYGPAVAKSEINDEAGGLPAISYSYSQNPIDGNLTITESDPLVKCPDPAYPPTTASCGSFIGTGVRVERTIEQTNDGHLVTISDRYASTDSQSHSLDLLPQNDQRFGQLPVENGEAIGYRFPGESSFHVRHDGESVAFGDEAPGTVFIQVEGAPDGDESTGRGAIVFDRPASPATFNFVDSEENDFYFHQTATVPAGGSSTFRFAYAQGYTNAEVEALAAQAQSAFRSAPVPAPPNPPSASSSVSAASSSEPARPSPSSTIKVDKVKLNKRKGTATVLAHVSGPGIVVLTGKGIVKQKGTSHGVGVVKLAVKTKGKAKRLLIEKGRAKVRAKLTFRLQGSNPVSVTRTITLKKRLRH